MSAITRLKSTLVRLVGGSTLFVLLASPASAGSPFQQQFLAKGLEIPRALQAYGYERFGSFALSEFMGRMPSMPVAAGSAKAIGYSNDDGRITAHWDRKAVAVNVAQWNRFPQQRPVLALHEYLNFFGYDDREYRISMAMWTLSLPETHSALRADECARLEAIVTRYVSVRMAGGVIGVGGGGESATIFARMHGIQRSLEEFSQVDHDQAVQSLEIALSSNATASYSNALTPKHKRAIEKRAREILSHPSCLTSVNGHDYVCPMKAPKNQYDDCFCPGVEKPGVFGYVSKDSE